MKRLITVVTAIVLAGTIVLAHGNFVHVRGVVTSVSAQSITVQTKGKETRTLTLSDKTAFKQAGKPAQLSDIKVGDRVVVDVPQKKSEAVLIQIGTAPTR
jgi:hypothetical protein